MKETEPFYIIGAIKRVCGSMSYCDLCHAYSMCIGRKGTGYYRKEKPLQFATNEGDKK